ncbi:MAG: hypothetical protein JWO73_766 [Candidatus Taylorbacteria bacterium]|nr:hypothetical protein [Candidatus Taylorbacteria bacterium]
MLAFETAAQPVISSPHDGDTLYNGDVCTIKWKSTNSAAWDHVFISIQDQDTGTMSWVAFYVPNTGSFTWVVGKWETPSTHFTFDISDGGSGETHSSINITIPSGKRPVPVKTKIRKAVSVEWDTVPNHYYRLESSMDLKTWFVEYDKLMATSTNMGAVYYADEGVGFFRTSDVTP